LDRIHDIGLLCKNRIAKHLCPIELGIHHFEDGRGCNQRLDAAVPRLLVGRRLQLISFQVLVLGYPAFGLYHLERISRGHQHFGQQGVGVQRDWRNERVKLLGF